MSTTMTAEQTDAFAAFYAVVFAAATFREQKAAGKAYIAAITGVKEARVLADAISVNLTARAKANGYSMRARRDDTLDLLRAFDNVVTEQNYKVREANGLHRHRYNCGNDCCANHPGPVGSWSE